MKEKLKKRIRTLIVLLIFIIIPGLVHIYNSHAFESVKAYDIVFLFISGMLTGGLLIMVRDYFGIKKVE